MVQDSITSGSSTYFVDPGPFFIRFIQGQDEWQAKHSSYDQNRDAVKPGPGSFTSGHGPVSDPGSSFFKQFVQQQDESLRNFSASDTAALIRQKKGSEQRVSPVHSFDRSLLCSSVFKPHQLPLIHKSPAERTNYDAGWTLGLVVVCMIIMASVRTYFYRRLSLVLKAFLTPRQLSFLMRERNLLTDSMTPPLMMIQFLTYSLFFYQMISVTRGLPSVPGGGPVFFLLILAGVATFYGLRFLVIRITGWVFNVQEQSKTYIVNSLVINQVWGLALLPLCVIAMYISPGAGYHVLMFTATVFVLIFLYLLVRSFMVGLSVINFSRVYLILYLCTVEILPLFILGKFATGTLFQSVL
jgi:hypothetical protein